MQSGRPRGRRNRKDHQAARITYRGCRGHPLRRPSVMKLLIFLDNEERRFVYRIIKHIPPLKRRWKRAQAYLWTCVRNQRKHGGNERFPDINYIWCWERSRITVWAFRVWNFFHPRSGVLPSHEDDPCDYCVYGQWHECTYPEGQPWPCGADDQNFIRKEELRYG